MNNVLIITILSVLVGFTAGLSIILGIFLRKLNNYGESISHNKTISKSTIRKSSEYDAIIAKTLFKIKKIAKADKVILSRFHNGGYFCNGFEMQRFTVTHETPYGSKEPLQDNQLGTLISRYPVAMTTLATFGSWIVHDIEDCTDPNFKRDMEKYGFKAAYLFLIKQFDESEEGFLGINWNTTHVMEESDKIEVKNELPRLLGLMNMLEEHLKE